MSTSETDVFELEACPCGKGHILQSITTQDNPWSGTDISFSVGCNECSKLWKANSGYLSNIEDERAKTKAFWDLRTAEDAIVKLMDAEIEAYFNDPKFKSMAAEQREMSRLLLSPRNIVLYRQGRNEGKKFSELCSAHKNRRWLAGLASKTGKLEQLNLMCDAREAAEDEWRSRDVRTIPFDPTRKWSTP